jgi:hypothetical protein
MKTGKTIQELAAEIARQAESKHDYIAKTSVMEIVTGSDDKVALHLPQTGFFPLNDVAHAQVAEHAGIHRQYYDKMRKEAPDLLCTNVDRWFKKYPAARMVRTLDGNARAFLSDAYRPLDNFDFANATLPILAQRKLNVMSCEITDTRLYLKAVDEQLFRDVPVGYRMGDGSHRIFDTCAPAIILSNSEVGFGRLVVETGVYTRACTNLCLFSSGGMKRTHVGARHKMLNDVDNIDAILSEKTKQKTLEALWAQVGDVLSAAFATDVIGKRLEQIAETAGRKIEGKVEKVVELATKKFDLNQTEGENVLKHLIEGGSLTQYGLHAAITRTAQDVASYDRATELEYLGGKVIELAPSQWQELARAA